jgi:hypothetical protein
MYLVGTSIYYKHVLLLRESGFVELFTVAANTS